MKKRTGTGGVQGERAVIRRSPGEKSENALSHGGRGRGAGKGARRGARRNTRESRVVV